MCGAFGAFSALFGVAGVIIPFFQPHARSMREGVSFVLYALLAAAFTFGCFYSAKGVRELRSKARYVAVAIGTLIFVFGVWILLDVYLPERPGTFHGDDGYVVLMSPFIILIGAWLLIYLSLPHVKRQFSRWHNKER
jgi:hypothetical protein